MSLQGNFKLSLLKNQNFNHHLHLIRRSILGQRSDDICAPVCSCYDKLVSFIGFFQEFKRMSDLKAHMRYHTGNLLRCKDCGKGFPRMQQLRIHQVQNKKNQSRVLTFPSIAGQALEASWDKSRYKSHYNLEPFWGWKKTPKGKPPGIGCEGWKTCRMWPGIESTS